MLLLTLSSPTQSLWLRWTVGTPRSENLTPSSGCSPAGQAENKDLHPELLVFRGHCCPRTQRDGPYSVGQSGQDAPFPKGHSPFCPVPMPGRTSPPKAMGGCLAPTSGANHAPRAPHCRDASALHDHRWPWYPPP